MGRSDGGNSSVTLFSTQQAFPHGGKKRVQDDLPIRYQECFTADSKCMFMKALKLMKHFIMKNCNRVNPNELEDIFLAGF